MSLWDTITDAGSNVLGQVTETAGSIWQTVEGGVESVADRWVNEKTGQLNEYERDAEAVFTNPWGIEQPAPSWETQAPPPDETSQPRPPSMLARWGVPVVGLVLAGVAVFALFRR